MSDIRTIILNGHIPSSPDIEFLQAEMSTKYRLPFARVVARYTNQQGEKEEKGLRLDLDKRSFLDHFENSELEDISRKAALKISEYLGGYIFPDR